MLYSASSENTSKLLLSNKIKVLDLVNFKTPGLHPAENRWQQLKAAVSALKSSDKRAGAEFNRGNCSELFSSSKERWATNCYKWVQYLYPYNKQTLQIFFF